MPGKMVKRFKFGSWGGDKGRAPQLQAGLGHCWYCDGETRCKVNPRTTHRTRADGKTLKRKQSEEIRGDLHMIP